ncbi:MAG: prolipoprotein diacylglyceryl transferase, partial [Spirochaetales bacterium]|nr:prolipoprotein diacylglyceryl transferase [Spirochaetales bacterium]
LRKRIPYRGFIIAFYVLWYGAWRFLIDYFRVPLGSDYWLRLAADPTIPPYRLLTPWNFIASQFWSGLMIITGVGLMVGFSWWEARRRRLAEAERATREQSRSRNTRRKLRAHARSKG